MQPVNSIVGGAGAFGLLVVCGLAYLGSDVVAAKLTFLTVWTLSLGCQVGGAGC